MEGYSDIINPRNSRSRTAQNISEEIVVFSATEPGARSVFQKDQVNEAFREAQKMSTKLNQQMRVVLPPGDIYVNHFEITASIHISGTCEDKEVTKLILQEKFEVAETENVKISNLMIVTESIGDLITVEKGGQLDFSECVFETANRASSVRVHGQDSCLRIKGCYFLNWKVNVQQRATGKIEHSHFVMKRGKKFEFEEVDNAPAVLFRSSKGENELSHCEFTDHDFGVIIEYPESSVDVVHCNFRCLVTGIMTKSCARCKIEDTKFTYLQGKALVAETESSVELSRVDILGTSQGKERNEVLGAIEVFSGASLKGSTISVENIDYASAVVCQGNNSSIFLEVVKIKNCKFGIVIKQFAVGDVYKLVVHDASEKGVFIQDSSVLIEDAQVSNKGSGKPGIVVMFNESNKEIVTLRDCKSRDCSEGVKIEQKKCFE